MADTVWELSDVDVQSVDVEVRGRVFRLDPEPDMRTVRLVQSLIRLSTMRETAAGQKRPKRSVVDLDHDIAELTDQLFERVFGKETYETWLDGRDGREPMKPREMQAYVAEIIRFYFPPDEDGDVDPKE